MKKKTVFTLAVVVGLALGARPARAQSQELTEAQKRALGAISDKLTYLNFELSAVPSWIEGDLGPATGDPGGAALGVVRRLGDVYRMSDSDSFVVRTTEADEIGQVHARLQQQYRGLRVVGGELIVHMEAGQAIGVNGHYVPDLVLGTQPGLSAEDALSRAERELTAGPVTAMTEPELVVFTGGAEPRLAWSRTVSYAGADGSPQIDVAFADAATGALLGRHSQIWTAKWRKVHDGTGLGNPAQLPGPLLISEGQAVLPNDNAAKDAYFGTGKAWDFYKYVLYRDSYDAAGSAMVSTVHFGGNNAGWYPALKQMVFGDGDGLNFTYLTGDLDVVAHELTHGVTQFTAGLIYEKEPGGLNEAMSDIMGESIDAFQGCVTGKIGEDVTTPNVPGDALRYMYDPTLDGYSLDYYPDYLSHPDWAPPGCMPHPIANDNCGVHGTSGIANLAFYLLTMGGTHPQGKTQVVVPEVGINIARKIFYRSLFYMTSTSGFSDAREATVKAAYWLYRCADLKTAVVDAVNAAWDAVGVPEISNNLWPIHPGLPGPVSPCLILPDSIELFDNAGFEYGPVVWFGTPGVVTSSAQQPNWGGSWKAWLGGDGFTRTETLKQRVHIPAIATAATLTFRMHVNTAENGGLDDTLTVSKSSGCGLLQPVPVTLATWSNLQAGPGFVLKTINLAPYIGQDILLTFTSSENGSLQTSFVLDAMSVAVK
jgi:Zn-dependent metalloprotease